MLLSRFLKKSIIPSLKKRKTFAYLHMIFKFLYNSTGARTSTILRLHLPASTYHSLPMQTQFTLATLSYLPLFPEEDLRLHISYHLLILSLFSLPQDVSGNWSFLCKGSSDPFRQNSLLPSMFSLYIWFIL